VKILLVEDNPMNRAVIGAMLAAADLITDEAESGDLALAMIAETSYDLVLMDLRMPGMDGLTAIKAIRSRPDDKAEVPIIVITADSTADLHATCKDAGADGFLLKPIVMEDLFAAMAATLTARPLERRSA
jgi:CheY-like chemotaxis protein